MLLISYRDMDLIVSVQALRQASEFHTHRHFLDLTHDRVIDELLVFCDGLLHDGMHHTICHFLECLHMHHRRRHGLTEHAAGGLEYWVCIEHGVAHNKIDCLGKDGVRANRLVVLHPPQLPGRWGCQRGGFNVWLSSF